MTTLTPIAPVIDANGITITDYETKLNWLKAQYQSIFGNDIYIENDSQDGELIAIICKAFQDYDNVLVSVFNSYSPSTSQGTALSNNVKINGIRRQTASYSSVDVEIVGQEGTTIINGQVGDGVNKWSLPDSVVIPSSGTITVTATCMTEGAIVALADTITNIITPTRGWQSVTNPDAASIGAPVESDADLRRRQTKSTALAAEFVLDSIEGAIANLSGVTRVVVYENDTDTTNGLGIPDHSISAVVEGGDSDEIATAIAVKKASGTGTYGDVNKTVIRANGSIVLIDFFRPDPKRIKVYLSITIKSGYSSTVADQIKQGIADLINDNMIGNDVEYDEVYSQAKLNNSPTSKTYKIDSLTMCIDGDVPAADDVAIAFNEVSICSIDDIEIT